MPYIPHQCRGWFGFPKQVWAATLQDDLRFYYIQNITDIVVFVKTKVNFGRNIGEHNMFLSLLQFLLTDHSAKRADQLTY